MKQKPDKFSKFLTVVKIVCQTPIAWRQCLMIIGAGAFILFFAFSLFAQNVPQPQPSPTPEDQKETADKTNRKDSNVRSDADSNGPTFEGSWAHGSPAYVFKNLRYDEDWSYLADPQKRTASFDRFKYISLGKKGWYLSIGGEIRERYEYLPNEFWGEEPKDTNGFFLQRYMLHADVHFGSRARIFFQLKSGIESGRKTGARLIDEDRLDVNQAFFDFNFFKESRSAAFFKQATLRAGRQELSFGSNRLVSTREGPNVRQSFDGARLTANIEKWRVDFFAVKPVNSKFGIFDDDSDNTRTFWGAYGVRSFKLLPGGKVDVYYFGFDRKTARFVQSAGDLRARESRQTFGTRFWGKKGSWDYNNEFILQTGRFGANRILAGAVSGEIGYTFENVSLRPRFGLRADVISGDGNPRDQRLNTFNPLFASNGYFGDVGLLTPANLYHLNPSVELRLLRGVSASIDSRLFWRQSTSDGIYRPSLIAVRTGLDSTARYVGFQPSLELKWQVSDHLSLNGIYTYFQPGKFLHENPPDRPVNFFTVWAQYRF